MEIETGVSDIIGLYKDVALRPSPISATLQITPDRNIINVYSLWSVPDLIESESTKFSQEFVLEYKSEKCTLLSRGIPCDISSVSLCAFTQSRRRFAVLKKAKKNDDSAFLEVWDFARKYTFDMSDSKEHGKIYDNGTLQSFEWSANELYILYIAEVKQKKSESYFKDLFCQKTDQKSGEETTKGEENLYRETWGETHTSAHHSVLCILEVETGKVEVLNLDDKFPNVSVAQATWGPNDESVVFVGYKEAPSRLGLTYCCNRRSSIFSYNLSSKEVECLTDDQNVCVEYPVFSPNHETFVFVQNEAGGPHNSCRKLMKCDWKSKEISTVIDIVDNADDEDFAGVYLDKLSSRWWSRDSRFFFFHTYRRSFMEIFYVDILSSEVKRIDVGKSYGTCILHDVKDPYILVSMSSPNIRRHLMIGYFTITEDGVQMIWNLVDDIGYNNPRALDMKTIGYFTKTEDEHLIWNSVGDNGHYKLLDLNWKVHTLTPSLPNPNYSNLDYDIITVASDFKKNGTLIIFPHGGPHSVLCADFYVYSAVFARLGYIVCKVNYRGSIGFGKNSIQSLLGNIGSQDVSDVVNAIEYLKKDETLGIKHVVGFGGSHGGFLIAHLLGQYPDLLKAAVIRNPVIDLSSMAGTSDIPDWCWIESGCSQIYDPAETNSPSSLQEMWEKSPIKYIKNVKSPTLLCLGKNDLRVPPSQGLLFHRYLRAQNVPTKVYMYDDGHALSKVPVSSDVFMQTVLWFQSH